MPYVLGIHVGGTTTSAAVARRDGGRWSSPAPVPLSPAAQTVPTVLCRVQDGSFVAGEAASRQEATHHEWVVRGFTRRVGEDTPLLVGSEFTTAQALFAAMVEWVADTVAAQLGHPAEHIAIAHSAAWGPMRAHLVRQALAALGLRDVTLVPEPVAVALDYAGMQQVPEQAPVAIAKIGGGGSDVALLRRRAPGFDVLGSPLDGAQPAGQDLDDEVFGHVREVFGEQVAALDPADPAHRAALTGLRGECVRAKEALSYHPGATVRVELPGLRTDYALSRSRYEQLARPHLERVPELLLQVAQSANVATGDLAAVVLAGGVVRTPLAKQLVAERLETAPQVDQAPELVAARGAAVSAVQLLSGGDQARQAGPAAAAETSVLMKVDGTGSDRIDVVDALPEPAAEPRPPIEVEPMYLEPPDEDRQRLFKILKLSAAALLIMGGLVLTIVQGFNGGHALSPATSSNR